ncbi:MAG: DNA cytosine methyltransferase [Deltaproteobacteria bacterium]|nr:DNA cytosine methyltransferase [Deltaproteobacteria bacterium]
MEDFNNLPERWRETKDAAGIIDENENRGYPGYNIVHKDVVTMSEVGVPQARRRVIIVGMRKDLDGGASSSLEADLNAGLSGGGSLFSRFPLTSLEVFEGLPLPELDDRYRGIMREYEGVWDEIGTEDARRWKEEVWDSLEFDVVRDYLFMNGISGASEDELSNAFAAHRELLKELGYYGRSVIDVSPRDGSGSIPNEGEGVRNRMKMIPLDKNHIFVSGTRWHVNGRGMSLIYRRIHPLKPAYTVVAYGGGGTWSYHYERGRSALTNRERARLQTFSDDFLFTGSRSEVRAQIGEAVAEYV